MPAKRHLGTITIMVKDRQTHAADMNQMLTDNGHMILARLGVNVQRACIEHCTGMITLAVEGTAKQIREVTKSLDQLYGIVAKAIIITE